MTVASARGPIAKPEVRFRVLMVARSSDVFDAVTRLAVDFDVVTAENARTATELMRRDTFHVVCTDYDLPDGNGADLLARAGELPLHTSTLLFSASEHFYGLQDVTRHYVLVKPFDPKRLISLMTQLARVSEMKRSVSMMSSSVRRKPTI